jgi:hypothetical protein
MLASDRVFSFSLLLFLPLSLPFALCVTPYVYIAYDPRLLTNSL